MTNAKWNHSYYAREVVDGPEGPRSQYCRFDTVAERKNWLAKDTVNRTKVDERVQVLKDMRARGVTWDRIDGVSYAREPA